MRATEKKTPVRGQAQPGLDCRSAEAACNPNPKRGRRKAANHILHSAGEPLEIVVSGRIRWALDRLRMAKPRNRAPITEPHGSAFAGHHARYVLRAPARAERSGLGCGMTEAPNPTRPARAQETADDWLNVVAVLAPGWRVIVCRDGLQWILQRRKNGGAERPWRAVHYCRTREALLRLCASLCGQVDPIAQATLAALPDHIGRADQ